MAQPQLTLCENDVHFWQFGLIDVDEQHLCYLESLLCIQERERARRFRFLKDRDLFILTRGVLRVLLGAYLEMDPAQIAVSYNEWGKPVLDHPFCDTLHFNVSHSAGRALIGVSRLYAIGVDIECVEYGFDVMDVARTVFTPTELKEFSCLSGQDRIEAFYRGWVRKEAYIKACGMGLSLPLDSFDVSLKLNTDPVLRMAHESCNQGAMFIIDLPSVTSYVAAFAVSGRNLLQQHFDGWHNVQRYLPQAYAGRSHHCLCSQITADYNNKE